ncbi:hypothetical protein C5S53_08200 [Methanophagales archaeon]|nr:hypothetical protein C5S53_08200 [Methanophagales archaeon]
MINMNRCMNVLKIVNSSLVVILASMFVGVVSAATTITIDGNFLDWIGVSQYDVAPNPIEPTGDVHGPSNNDLDLVDIHMTDDGSYIYIKYNVLGTMNEVTYKYEVFLDTDKSTSTGYRGPEGTWTWGADYMVENNGLYDYDDIGATDQSDWKWDITDGGFSRAIGSSNTVEMRIPRDTIGETGLTDDLKFAIRAVNDPQNPTNWDLYPEALYSFHFCYDNTPPVTTKIVGTPKYDSYVTSSTPITLSATDPGPCSSGVDKTYYRINGGGGIVYTGPFTLFDECSHTIDYYSVDNVGNEETIHSQTLYVDNSAPITTKIVGTPKYDSYVTSSTPITLSASDLGTCASGVDKIYYRINSGGGIVYTGPFTLFDECSHTIDYYSVDNVGNEETIHSQTLYVDNSAPIITKTVDPAAPDGCNGWYVSVITISLSATDPDPHPSGVGYTEVDLDGSGWVEGTWVCIGEDGKHTLQYRSVDNVENVEDTHTQNYKLDKANPTITKDNPSDGDYVCGTVTISGSAYDAPDSDSGSGIDYIQINIDGSDVYTYVPLPNPAYGTVPFSYDWDTTGYPDGSSHSITAKADDDAGRSASPDVENVVVNNKKADLSASLSADSPVNSGDTFNVKMTVSNAAGSATANNVAPSSLSVNTLTGDASVSSCGGHSPNSANIPGGSSQDFTWTCTASGERGHT